VTTPDERTDPVPQPAGDPLCFEVTWDYRCPFARNIHEHLVAALGSGAEWEVTFVPFSLSQAHVEEGGISVFDDPSKSQDLLAMQVGIVVRDRFPERFLALHSALFSHRHDEGRDLRDENELRITLKRSGVDAEVVFQEITEGWPLETFRREHEAAERRYAVFGVPTFIVEEKAAFVRIMSRPEGDAKVARQTIEDVVTLFSELPELNEFKYTRIPN
jgi:predicted DsbA family dithiol-disulfide isomerase